MKTSDFTGGNTPPNNTGGNPNTPPPPASGGGQGVPISGIPMPQAPQDDENERPDALINYNDIADEFDQALFREEEMNRMVTILSSMKKANALLVGDAGVGKTQLVEEFARQYVIEKDPVLIKQFGDDLQIEELRIASLISGKSMVGQLEQEVEKILTYAKENNVIIFIDELHRLFSDRVAGNVGQDLKQALARKDMKFIGATTTQEVSEVRKESAFDRRWSDVIVDELTPKQTEEILENVTQNYESFHNVTIPEHLIPMIVRYGDKYKKAGSHRPDSALTLMDRVSAHVGIEGVRRKQSSDPQVQQYLNANPIPRVAKKDVARVAKSLIEKPSIKKSNQSIEEALDQSIVGQASAKDNVANMVNRLQLNLTESIRPKSFLFTGPTGTGKSEMANQLADYLFGSKDALIRLDMSEFSEKSSINRIKGSADGYVGSDSKQPLPFDTLQSNPRQVILLDEFEKADQQVQLLFMQVLDEGSFTTERHTTVDFSKAIVIATTNAGTEELSTPSIGFNQSDEISKTEIVNTLSTDFPKELLNRFEHMIVFDKLSIDEYKQILAIKYNAFIEEAQKNRPDLQFSPKHIDKDDDKSLSMLDELAEETYNPQFNGRPAQRSIEKHIEDHLLAHIKDVKQEVFKEASTQPQPLQRPAASEASDSPLT